MNRGKISAELLKIIDETEDTTSIETRVRTSPKMKSTVKKVRMIMAREIFEGPGSVTSEINEMSTNGKVYSFRVEVIADMDLVGIKRFSNCEAVDMISLALPKPETPPPVHNDVGC
ncbi:MAG: hypothetical protein AAB965_03230 [Patescibacteria group bacterium]